MNAASTVSLSVLQDLRLKVHCLEPSLPAAELMFDEAADRLLLAAMRSAVIAPEREVRRWFPFGGARVDVLCERGELRRLIVEGVAWLTHPRWVSGISRRSSSHTVSPQRTAGR
jgi:hypothetical protein